LFLFHSYTTKQHGGAAGSRRKYVVIYTTQPRYPRKRAPVPIRQGAFDVVANGKIPASVRNQISVAQNTVGHYGI
jgi:hypothetical protein